MRKMHNSAKQRRIFISPCPYIPSTSVSILQVFLWTLSRAFVRIVLLSHHLNHSFDYSWSTILRTRAVERRDGGGRNDSTRFLGPNHERLGGYELSWYFVTGTLTAWLLLCLTTVNGGRGGGRGVAILVNSANIQFPFVHTNLSLALPLHHLLLEFDLARLHVVLGKRGEENWRSKSMQPTPWNRCTGHRAILTWWKWNNTLSWLQPSPQVQYKSMMLTDHTGNPSFIRKMRNFEK